METKALILKEIESVSEPILTEVLDFLISLKAKRTLGKKQISVVSASGEVSVSLETLAMQEPELANQIIAEPMPVKDMCDELRQALDRSEYTTRESIVELVQDVKREMLLEQEASPAADYT